jgi:hypothetical protein
MCRRFTHMASPEVIAQQFDVATPPLFTPRDNIAPSQSIAATRHGHTDARHAPLGAHPVLGHRPDDWASVHQCQSGDRGGETFVSCRLQGTALLGNCAGVLRGAGPRACEAADGDRSEESPTLWRCRFVETGATSGRRSHRILYDPHDGTERIASTDSQPDAGHAGSHGLRPMVRSDRSTDRTLEGPPPPVPERGAHGLPRQYAREQPAT